MRLDPGNGSETVLLYGIPASGFWGHIATDNEGNIYWSGASEGTFEIHGVSYSSHGIAVVKFDPQGRTAWVRTGGSSARDMVSSMVVDPDDNVIVTGIFQGDSLSIGDRTFARTKMGFGDDAFIAKHNSDGELVWAMIGRSTDTARGSKLASDSFGNIYVSIQVRGLATFGNAILDRDAILKMDPDGNVIWKVSSDVWLLDSPIASDSLGTLYIAYPTLGISGPITLSRFQPDGSLEWTREIATAASVHAIVANSESVWLTGGYLQDAVFFGDQSFPNAGGLDLYVLELAPSGEPRWILRAGSAADEHGYDLATDGYGHLFIAVESSSSPDYGLGSEVGGSHVVAISRAQSTRNETYEGRAFHVSAPYPNPSSDRSLLDMEVDRPQHVRVALFDMIGREVRVLFDGYIADKQALELDAAGLPSGTYLIRAETESQVLSRTVTVVR